MYTWNQTLCELWHFKTASSKCQFWVFSESQHHIAWIRVLFQAKNWRHCRDGSQQSSLTHGNQWWLGSPPIKSLSFSYQKLHMRSVLLRLPNRFTCSSATPKTKVKKQNQWAGSFLDVIFFLYCFFLHPLANIRHSSPLLPHTHFNSPGSPTVFSSLKFKSQ